ncbi:MAG TPA: hypothetical protein VMN57_11140 [Anaerolineales bacterium]|nr:hypothetical protein [Anaerolineales bacterium]
MPNPFTRFINRGDPASEFSAFVESWDGLEALLIDVYRRGGVSPGDEGAWAALRGSIQSIYPTVRTRIEPHRRDPAVDPVPEILGLASIDAMVGNRHILRLLPDVREAINRVLLEE